MDADDRSTIGATSGDDGQVRVVHVGNTGELADQIVRRTRSRWIFAWAVVATALLALLVLGAAQGYRERQDRATEEASEVDARTASEPTTGEGYRVTAIRCQLGDESATYSGQITNTGNAPRDYSVSVKFVDADGVEIGASDRSVNDLGPKKSANFRLSGSLVRFARGAPLKRCVAGVEPGQPGCADLLIVGARVSDEAWSRGCTGEDRKQVPIVSHTCRDDRKLWVSSLGYAYSGEPFQAGDAGAEERHCVIGS